MDRGVARVRVSPITRHNIGRRRVSPYFCQSRVADRTNGRFQLTRQAGSAKFVLVARNVAVATAPRLPLQRRLQKELIPNAILRAFGYIRASRMQRCGGSRSGTTAMHPCSALIRPELIALRHSVSLRHGSLFGGTS